MDTFPANLYVDYLSDSTARLYVRLVRPATGSGCLARVHVETAEVENGQPTSLTIAVISNFVRLNYPGWRMKGWCSVADVHTN